MGEFKKPVGQGTFSVIDMCDNAKIPGKLHNSFAYFGMRKGSVFQRHSGNEMRVETDYVAWNFKAFG
jgi:hypothetical protein